MNWNKAIKPKEMMLKNLKELGLFSITQEYGITIAKITYAGKTNVFLDPVFLREFIDKIWPCRDCIFRAGEGVMDYSCLMRDDPLSDYPFVSDCHTYIPKPQGFRYIYFSHSLKEYNTAEEKEAIVLIKKHFPQHVLLNPNLFEYQGTMFPYLLMVKVSDVLVFKRYRGYVTSGVGREIEYALELGIPVYELKGNVLLEREDMPANVLTREQTVSLYKYGHI
ncbi:MAG: hypothetical protein J7L47_05620 [Candidatus Odinarchaeota archaeon]|nr:hypothetical protein [Candidatus Odinarchaeota archaeon]